LRILITGGTGFVGAHLIRFLQAQDQDNEIFVLASGKPTCQEPGVKYHEADIRDADAVRRLLREIKPGHIYHLAGITAIDFSWAHPRLTYEVNVFGALNLFEAAMNLPLPPRILNVGTSQVYAPVSGALTEESPLRPASPYAASKAMAELLATQYRDRETGGILTVRPFNHTGCGQPPNFVLPSIAKQFVEIELGLRPPKLSLGNIHVGRDFTDVRDVVRAYVLVLEKGRTSEVYNVCSGTPVLLSDILQMFQKISGIDVTLDIDPNKVRPAEVAEIYGDPGKLRAATSWLRKITLEKTIEDILNCWRSEVS
jgi:GDP-4-dehydro-6-deoxy-D-mannose reductase